MAKTAPREAYGKSLVKLGEANPDIVVLDADLSKSTRTAAFAAAFPDRFFDVGIAEQNLIGTAAGLAAAGKIPFVSSFAVFATGRSFEQIRNAVAYPGLNVKIVATHAGITVGEDGGSHQAVADVAIMRALPNMTVIVPADAVETEKAVAAAAAIEGPVYIRLGRSGVPSLYDAGYKFAVGRADTLRRGADAAVIANGLMVHIALEAAAELAGQGIEAAVINMSTVKPLDLGAVLTAAGTTGAIVTVEEHTVIGGLGSAVAEALVEHAPVPMVRLGIRDRFGESGLPEELLVKYGLTPGEIVRAVKDVVRRKKEKK
jgi:transketolase